MCSSFLMLLPDLESQLGFEHLGGIVHIHVWPGHVLQSVVCDGEPFSQVQSQGLPAVGEDVEGHLGALPLHVGDELLQQRGGVHLGSDPLNFSLTLKYQ